ncbi:hypothetical protein Pmani_014121 [Petrolisthes manimaculis]|uniref:TMEM248/TMEM219 domain-containing protein n=1 Tax=Petrolisthes manimaculis TaxID=1843537 RepID=A0AAE1U902_9EUCA|nr:hypothetical protein Pmani_014121 [Petrolisthes manimaculis]
MLGKRRQADLATLLEQQQKGHVASHSAFPTEKAQMAGCSGIREFMGSRPPVAVFFASIAVFALTLISVSLYLQSHKTQILNPDIEDWNSFYNTLSNMEICFPNQDSPKMAKMRRSERELPSIASSVPPTMSSNITNDATDNVTVSVMADVHVLKSQHSLFGVTLHAVLPASHLGIKRDPSVLDITMQLPTKKSKKWVACLLFTGPPHLLPNSPIAPPNCSLSMQSSKKIEVELGGGWLAGDSQWCQNDVVGSLTVMPKDELNVYLTEGDVTLIQMHILYTTCLLGVMMLGILLYLVCGRRCATLRSHQAVVAVAPDKVPLNP